MKWKSADFTLWIFSTLHFWGTRFLCTHTHTQVIFEKCTIFALKKKEITLSTLNETSLVKTILQLFSRN